MQIETNEARAEEKSHVVPAVGLSQHLVAQNWADYSAEQHSVWQLLYAKRIGELQGIACTSFFDGAKAIGLNEKEIPDLRLLNRRLAALTGWEALPVNGFLDAKLFFHCLSRRRFPTTTGIRPLHQLDYLPEPDIFHDVFGHVPMHADPRFARLLQRFALLAENAKTESDMERLARFFWFTVEFGLVLEGGEVRVYGSGLISSATDCENALSDGCVRRPFHMEEVMHQPFSTSEIQRVLFVIESFEQLEGLVARFH